VISALTFVVAEVESGNWQILHEFETKVVMSEIRFADPIQKQTDQIRTELANELRRATQKCNFGMITWAKRRMGDQEKQFLKGSIITFPIVIRKRIPIEISEWPRSSFPSGHLSYYYYYVIFAF
jgi:hypothetical protein